MNFFGAQDQARRTSRWLVLAYLLSAVLIVAGVTAIVAAALYQGAAEINPAVLTATAIGTVAVIVGATLYKTSILSAGGGRVARDMGGTPVPANVQDPLRRRLRNVVEEIAIASGVPVPEIYVLEEEPGINAFAAGFSPGDAAIAVTRGTLELLNREELQGVIAHEFSHILNGDMRINIRMMGVLFGIMVIGLIGRMVLRAGRHTGANYARRGKNAGAVMIIGLGFTVLGWVGVVCARLIKAAVSRQREFLADASAVQFTRQTDGIANALKKIGGYTQHSYLRVADPEEVSHMLFAGGAQKLASLFATHPPLIKRIQALDPSFRAGDYPEVSLAEARRTEAHEEVAGLAGSTPLPAPQAAPMPANVADIVGQPGAEQIGFAQELRGTIPESLYDACHSPHGAYLLTLALVIDPAHAERQLGIIASQLGDARAAEVARYVADLDRIGPHYRLPLLEITFPALKQRPAESLDYLLDLMRRLIELDGQVDFHEFCLYRITARHLRQAVRPAAESRQNRVKKSVARQAAVDLLWIVAAQGNPDPLARKQAFVAGLEAFGAWATAAQASPGSAGSVQRLEEALDILTKMNNAGRQSLVEAVARTSARDRRLAVAEAELLRAICATLDCPLPPIFSGT